VVIGNVTRDPALPAVAVEDPEIGSVLSLRTGQEYDSRKFIEGIRYDKLVGGVRTVLSDSIREGKPRLVCPICTVPVRLVASQDKRFFFRHVVEDGSCPAVTRSCLDEAAIRAIKYNGARESDAHRLTKLRIAESLSADPRFTEIAVESTWHAKAGKGLRRPDVQALNGSVRLAFEAQLTTTFLDVVRGRRAFYLEDGALLVWILRRFNPEDRRMTEDDILFSNNSNILVVDEQTWRVSQAAGRFMVRVHFREPFLDPKGHRSERWRESVVGFDDLTLDYQRQRVYLFDFEAVDAEVERQAAEQVRLAAEREREEAAKKHAERLESLREEIFSYWSDKGFRRVIHPEELEEWEITVNRASAYGISLPQNLFLDPTNFTTAVAVLLSAKRGRPAGYAFVKLLQVAHQVAENHEELLLPFLFALRAYGTEQVILREDKSDKWKARSKDFSARIEAASEKFYAPLPYAGTLRFLFPQIAEAIRG